MNVVRAIVAAGASLIFPGAGHALIREWSRALLFSGLFILSVWVFLPVDELTAAVSSGAFADVPGILETETSMIDQFMFTLVVVFAAFDAGLSALGLAQRSGGTGSEPTCPYCRKPLDEDLAFCHWCTTPLESDGEESASS